MVFLMRFALLHTQQLFDIIFTTTRRYLYVDYRFAVRYLMIDGRLVLKVCGVVC